MLGKRMRQLVTSRLATYNTEDDLCRLKMVVFAGRVLGLLHRQQPEVDSAEFVGGLATLPVDEPLPDDDDDPSEFA